MKVKVNEERKHRYLVSDERSLREKDCDRETAPSEYSGRQFQTVAGALLRLMLAWAGSDWHCPSGVPRIACVLDIGESAPKLKLEAQVGHPEK